MASLLFTASRIHLPPHAHAQGFRVPSGSFC